MVYSIAEGARYFKRKRELVTSERVLIILRILDTGTWDKGDAYRHPALTRNYEMGKEI